MAWLQGILDRIRNLLERAWSSLFQRQRKFGIERTHMVELQAYLNRLAASPPSLPQNDGLAERLERKAQLNISRTVYAYDTSKSTGLDIPMATLSAAIADS